MSQYFQTLVWWFDRTYVPIAVFRDIQSLYLSTHEEQ
jgi:hypothetical protein